MDNLYSLLNIPITANDIAIKRAYQILARPLSSTSEKDKRQIHELTIALYILTSRIYRPIYDESGFSGLINNGFHLTLDNMIQTQNETISIDDLYLHEIFHKKLDRANSMITLSNLPTQSIQHYPTQINLDDPMVIKHTELISVGDLYIQRVVERTINRKTICVTCKGTGADDGILRLCKKCRGRRTLVTMMDNKKQTSICYQCNGYGNNTEIHKCSICNGTRIIDETHQIHFTIPIGVENGELLILKNEGNIVFGSIDTRHDIIIRCVYDTNTVHVMISTQPGIQMTRNIQMRVNIPLINALCGVNKEIVLPNGSKYILRLDNVKQNDVHIIDDGGLPYRNDPLKHGKLYVYFDIIYPIDLSLVEKKQLYDVLKRFDENVPERSLGVY